MSSSVQLTVDSARSTATRLGNQYSISGSNVGTSDGTTAGMLTGGTVSSGVYSPGTITANQLTPLVEKHSPLAPHSCKAMLCPSAASTGSVPNFGSILLMHLELLATLLVRSEPMVLLL